jgi:hypothetical protein
MADLLRFQLENGELASLLEQPDIATHAVEALAFRAR